MDEILDDLSEKKKEDKYIKLSYKRLVRSGQIFTLALLIILIAVLLRKLGLYGQVFIVLLFAISFAWSMVGIFQGIMSFIKKEDNTFKKWFSLFGNLFLVALYLALAFVYIIGGLIFDGYN